MKKDKPLEMIGIDHGTERINLQHIEHPFGMTPIELHHKSDGAIGDHPSIAILLERDGCYVFGQMSIDTLDRALRMVGYSVNSLK